MSQPSWSYVFTHHLRVAILQDRLSRSFPTFVHTSLVYKRIDKKLQAIEKPTVSGLLFIQGEPLAIQGSLNMLSSSLYLVKDSATSKPARIPDRDMQLFMRIASAGDRQIRYMLHPLGDYAEGRARIRVTEGILQGLEGYVVRLNKDRFLLTRMGNMTIAISGVHRDSFVNVDEYAAERRLTQSFGLTHLFVPQSDVDAHALAALIAQKTDHYTEIGDLASLDALRAEIPTVMALASPSLDLRPLKTKN